MFWRGTPPGSSFSVRRALRARLRGLLSCFQALGREFENECSFRGCIGPFPAALWMRVYAGVSVLMFSRHHLLCPRRRGFSLDDGGGEGQGRTTLV